jgi:hypothetical protein
MRMGRGVRVRVAGALVRRVARVSAMASVTGVMGVPPGVIAVASTYALERHDQKTGCSQEQRKCVQVHFSIEP